MSGQKWAPDDDEGMHPYVVMTREFAGSRVHSRIEYASALTHAKMLYGSTRAAYTTITIRRARPEDIA